MSDVEHIGSRWLQRAGGVVLVSTGLWGCGADGDATWFDTVVSQLNICNETVPSDHYVDGIPAYAQCVESQNSAIYSSNGVDTSTTQQDGWVRTQWSGGYQCTEYAHRYLHFAWDVTWIPNGNAGTWCNSTPPTDSGLVQTALPVHGDILVFAPGVCGASATYGHVAVVDVVDDANSRVTFVEQNGANRRTSEQSCADCYLHVVANDGTVPGTGGASGTGGEPATGGWTATGGDATTGGDPATGGDATTGGGPATGGLQTTGGNPATGGLQTTGGNPATGGLQTTGGNPATGGLQTTGGISSATGGTPASGGVLATGGVVMTGGQLGTGAVPAVGAQPASGGVVASGGYGVGGSGAAPAPQPAQPADPESDDEAGCACRTTGPRGSAPRLGLTLGMLALAVMVGRRRRKGWHDGRPERG